MNFEQAESLYKSRLEKAELDFSNGIKSKKDKNKLIKIYKESTKAARAEFFKNVKREKERLIKIKPKKKKFVPGEGKPFIASEHNIELTRWQKLHFKYDMFKFRMHIYYATKVKPKIPESFFESKIKFRFFISDTKKFFANTWEKIKLAFSAGKEKIKQIYTKIKNWINKELEAERILLKKLFAKKKKEGEDKDEKKEDKKSD